MATVKPFKAWRPTPQKAEEIVSVPYDVIDTEEAKRLALNKPFSFLHVIRPEIDLPDDTSLYSEEVYEKGSENLTSLLNSINFIQEENDALYLYKLSWKGRSQSGIFCCVSTEEYDQGSILKHELTRPDKEDDRTKHILTQQAHAEPVMMTFNDTEGISDRMKKIESDEPLYDLTIADVTHRIWKIDNDSDIVDAFSNIENLYIADGHHRCASASRAAMEMNSQNPEHSGNEEYNFFPAVIFPMDQMEILAYNRIIFSIPKDFMNRIKSSLSVEKSVTSVPEKKGQICIYLDNEWYKVLLPDSAKDDVASGLDVARLQEYILEPFLGITNQRTDTNISFVGGLKGTAALKDLVDSGKAEMAISMYPTDINELVAVSDADLLMPPKSTWFEPKLRSGFLVHTF
jgi:uncharacterized protein (DUF1015 family)